MSLYMEYKNWNAFSSEEKLSKISNFIENEIVDIGALSNEEKEVLRACIPAYIPEEGSNEKYIFISYSQRDAKKVYLDLAYFMYNPKMRVRFWYDEGLKFGKDWEKEAGAHLANKNCAGVLFYLSENLLFSSAVFKEIKIVKKLKKFWFSVALNPEAPSTMSILKKYSLESLEAKGISLNKLVTLAKFFPQKNTALIYYDWNNDARIKKLGKNFSVVYKADLNQAIEKDFLPDVNHLSIEEAKNYFEFEQKREENPFTSEITLSDGWFIKQYIGNSVDVTVPESIGDMPVIEISGNMLSNQVKTVKIPKTVTCITKVNEYFGSAEILEKIIVDEDNPVYFDLNGILCDKEHKEILRTPMNWDWRGQFIINQNANYALAQALKTNNFGYRAEDVLMLLLDDIYHVYRLGEEKVENKNLSEICRKRYEALQNSLNFEDIFNLMCAAHEKNIFKDIETVGSFAFANCKRLNFLFLPNNVKILKGFSYINSNIQLIFLPENIELSYKCFYGCGNLKSVLNEKLNSERYKLQRYYEIFEAVCLSDTVKASEGVFDACNITTVTVTGDNCSHLLDIFRTKKIEEVCFEYGVKEICSDCFKGCNNLKRIFIPSTVNYIALDAFIGCDKLEYIELYGKNFKWYELWDKSAEWYIGNAEKYLQELETKANKLSQILADVDDDDRSIEEDMMEEELSEIDSKTIYLRKLLKNGYSAGKHNVPEELRGVRLCGEYGVFPFSD